VILEAKIIEVELKDGYQSGINWAGLGRNNDYTVIGSQVGGGTILGDGGGTGRSEIAGQTGSLFGPIANTGFSAFGGVFSLAVRASDFAAFLELLRTQGDTQVLSSPRVSTVNNQKAVIKVGGDEFFVTNVTTNTTTTTVGGATVSEPSVTLTPFFSGIVLDVTPQIDENNNIMLHIHPSVSQVTQQNKTFKVSNRDFSLPLAVSTIQESDNVVRASSGQIIVIGGLMKEGSTDDNAAIPLVGDIPVVGNAFKHKKVSRIKKELVILLKPTVVDIAPIWGDQVQESHDRIKKLKRGAAEAE
jgi:MSHA biogenesis protein MshL